MATRKLQVEIIGDSSSLERALGKAGKSSSKFGGALKTMGKVAAVGVGAAFAGMAVVVKQGFDELAEGQQVAAQTAAALKSTGQVANVTAKEIDALAQSISRKTGIDDEAVQASENMLLTFTRVRNEVGKGNDIFNQTTQAVADMATRMNNGAVPSMEQLSTTSIRVGKALNDPVKGVGALSRVGVQFTEAQKEMIKEMVKSGDVMGAQKLILKELNTEFGGSAVAAGQTLPGQLSKLRNSFAEAAGEIAVTLLPHLQQFLDWVNRNMPTIQHVIQTTITAIAAVINFLVPIIRGIIKVFQDVRDRTQEYWPRIQAVIQGVINWFKTNVLPTVQAVVGAIITLWRKFGDDVTRYVQAAFNTILIVIRTVLINIRAFIQGIMALLRGDWQAAWDALKTIVSNSLRGLKDLIVSILTGIIPAVLNLAAQIGRAIIEGIISGFTGLLGSLKDTLVNGVKGAIGGVKGALGIGSPSRVMADEVGKPLAEGVIVGWLEGTRDLPDKMSEKIRAAVEAGAAAVADAKSVFSQAFSELSNVALSAFDKLTQDFETKTEKKIRQQDEKRAAEDRQRALREAETELGEAQAGGDPEAILNAQRALEEAKFAIQRAADERKAANERKRFEESRELQRRHFEEQLARLQQQLLNQEITAQQFNQRLIALFKKFEIPFKNAALKLGGALAEGLREAAVEVGKAAQKVRNEIERHLSNIVVRATVDVTVPDRPDRRQHGGPVRAGKPYIVGEVGPELFVPSQSGQIVANAATSGAAVGGMNIVLNFNGPTVGTSREFEDTVRRALYDVSRRNPGTGL